MNKIKKQFILISQKFGFYKDANLTATGHPADWPKTNADYEEFWGDPKAMAVYFEPGRLKFYQEILNLIKLPETGNILDIGCGNGFFLKKIADKVQDKSNYKFFGADYAESGLKVARKLLPQGNFYQCEAAKIPLAEKSMHLIVMMETLEHLKDWRGALDEAWRLLAPQGTLWVTIPDGTIDKWEGHTNFWTEAEFIEKLSKYTQPRIIRVDEGRTLLGIITK